MILDIVFEQIEASLEADLSGENIEIDVQFDPGMDLAADFGEVNVIVSDDVPRYEGDYEVNPTFTDQVLDTAGFLMAEDIKIEQIPLAVVSNNSGGMTVIIGG